MMKLRVFITFFALLLAGTVNAQDECCPQLKRDDAQLSSHEPITVGYTKDRDDVPFMDFKLSLRYKLAPEFFSDRFEGLGLGRDDNALFFAFSGRFAQYIGTRDSSPVVAKRFNPNFFYRHWTHRDHDEYVDFVFLGHESNGQAIHTPQQYQQARSTAERPEFANDQLSRGWDYLELVWKKVPQFSPTDDLTTYFKFKYFLADGLLQGEPEEYNTWENSTEGKARNRVDGLTGIVKYRYYHQWGILSDFKFAGIYETGYRDAFKYNTVRAELGAKVIQLPMTLWVQTGYGSDLAQYYKKVTSVGIQVEIGSF
jgi:outer membrane phospholipase A